VQVPPSHAAARVHDFPSLQLVPSFAFGFEHTPVAGVHVPAMWHWSLAVHVTGLDPVHTPDWHVFVWKQRFELVHAVPSVTGGFEHTPVAGLHVPTAWH